MLSSNLIRLVSDHWQAIADRVVRRIRNDPNFLVMSQLPDTRLRERSREILLNLGSWMISPESDIAERYERLGKKRCEDGMPLHEMVRALQVVKESMIQYVRDQGMGHTPLEIFAEEELEHGADLIFDQIIYYVVRGYERTLRGRTMAAA